MKLYELIERITSYPDRYLDLDVVIEIEKPFVTIGASPSVPVALCRAGIDWDNGKFIITPTVPLSETDNQFAEQFKKLQETNGWLEYENRNLKTKIRKLRKSNESEK